MRYNENIMIVVSLAVDKPSYNKILRSYSAQAYIYMYTIQQIMYIKSERFEIGISNTMSIRLCDIEN